MDDHYNLKGGYKVREFQLFKRTFPVTGSKELHSATYFIHKGTVFSVDPETGKPLPCNFGADYLNSRYKQTFEPLDEQYQFNDGAADKFYLDNESGTIRWLYYNPDSDAGGQYVENVFDFDLIREVAEAEDFFDHIGGCCKQYLIDVGTDDFLDYDELFKTAPCDFEDCTEATQTALIAAANAELTEGRVLFTKDNIEIDRELFIEDDHINAYVGLYLDVDARFSTSTYGTDDYVNAYANYFPATEELEFGYTLIKAGGSDSDFVAIELADSERTAILEKLREAGLDECVAEMEQDTDPDEDAGLTLM
jgi:hypothetical protein